MDIQSIRLNERLHLSVVLSTFYIRHMNVLKNIFLDIQFVRISIKENEKSIFPLFSFTVFIVANSSLSILRNSQFSSDVANHGDLQYEENIRLYLKFLVLT